MKEFKHILTKGEIKSGRIYISESAENEFMRIFGQNRDVAFNVFRSDGKLLVRTAKFQKNPNKAGIRLNCGQDTFKDCSVGTPIWLQLRPDGDIEIRIGAIPGPIIDLELREEVEEILEDPEVTNYWQAVNAATVILESRLRSKSQASSSLYGARLVKHAFEPPTGKLVCREIRGEQDGVYHLCLGVLKALRNPGSHQKQNYSRSRARQVVGIIDLLLDEIDNADVSN